MQTPTTDHPLRVVIEVPYLFSVRDFLFTPAVEAMKSHSDIHFYFMTWNDLAIDRIKEINAPNIHLLPITDGKQAWHKLLSAFLIKQARRFNDQYLYHSLNYRFSSINKLAHWKVRKNKSNSEQKRFQVIHEYSKGERAGFPFPNSHSLFKFFFWLHHVFSIPYPFTKSSLANLSPDLFVFGRIQWPTVTYRLNALIDLDIPRIGIVASWDHPTTKGPIPRGLSGYIVASKRMKDELVELHQLASEKVIHVGKPQMDIYRSSLHQITRSELLQILELPADRKVVLFGTNTTGWKEHEVSIAKWLADRFNEQEYGQTTLIIRTHPQDVDWERDFKSLEKLPYVKCIQAHSFGGRTSDDSSGDSDTLLLKGLMEHSSIVIQSRGSLALDAIAFNTPVISLAFDGDLDRPFNDSFLQEYEFEHYKPLVRAEGTWMVGSYKTLDEAIRAYLKDPTVHETGRRIIQSEHIEPIDGNASWRMINFIADAAHKARTGKLPSADMDHSGIGNQQWHTNQAINLLDYLDTSSLEQI